MRHVATAAAAAEQSESAAAELPLRSRDDSASVGVEPQRPKQNTATIVSTLRPSASGPRQDSDVSAEETAWCRSVKKPRAARGGTCVSEQFDTKQLMERHENVVQGATGR